ncbi:unnamed protein product, partial [Prorocentrum cordatum]
MSLYDVRFAEEEVVVLRTIIKTEVYYEDEAYQVFAEIAEPRRREIWMEARQLKAAREGDRDLFDQERGSTILQDQECKIGVRSRKPALANSKVHFFSFGEFDFSSASHATFLEELSDAISQVRADAFAGATPREMGSHGVVDAAAAQAFIGKPDQQQM